MEEKKNPKNFEEKEKLVLSDRRGNQLSIILKENEIRVFKIDFFLNDIFLRTMNFGGRVKAEAYWNDLKIKLKFVKEKKTGVQNGE